jgi:serine/threonine-protein kinase ULK/ATG1
MALFFLRSWHRRAHHTGTGPHAPAMAHRMNPLLHGASSETGVVVSHFRIGMEIGRGSFANVYKGTDITGKEGTVAIKSVFRNRLKNEKLVTNLEIEIKILRNLKNPHIVSLLDCVKTEHHFHLIMEYCSLGDLSYFIRNKHKLADCHPIIKSVLEKYPSPENSQGLNTVLVINFIKQLSSALLFLRSHNLIHRDIKPQNLLLSIPAHSKEEFLKRGYVGLWELPVLKVADFGFARYLPSTSMAETLCGSPLYMAPEILSYEKYNAKADLWSVGAVIYEMTVGRPPFRAANHIELLKKIEKANDVITFPTNYEIPQDLIRFICNLLKANPTDRVGFSEYFNDPIITSEEYFQDIGNDDASLSYSLENEEMYVSEFLNPNLNPNLNNKSPTQSNNITEKLKSINNNDKEKLQKVEKNRLHSTQGHRQRGTSLATLTILEESDSSIATIEDTAAEEEVGGDRINKTQIEKISLNSKIALNNLKTSATTGTSKSTSTSGYTPTSTTTKYGAQEQNARFVDKLLHEQEKNKIKQPGTNTNTNKNINKNDKKTDTLYNGKALGAYSTTGTDANANKHGNTTTNTTAITNTYRKSTGDRSDKAIGRPRLSSMDNSSGKLVRQIKSSDLVVEKDYVVIGKRDVEINSFADEIRKASSHPLERRHSTSSQRRYSMSVSPSTALRDVLSYTSEKLLGAANNSLATAKGGAGPGPGAIPAATTSSDAKTRKARRSVSSETDTTTKPSNDQVKKFNDSNNDNDQSGGGECDVDGDVDGDRRTKRYIDKLIINRIPPEKCEGDDMITHANEDVTNKIERLAMMAHAISLYASVKFEQVIPLPPSYNDNNASGANKLEAEGTANDYKSGLSADGQQKYKSQADFVDRRLCQEGLVLYVRTLSLLSEAIKISIEWWSKNKFNCQVSSKMGELIQWVRNRFNESLQKAEYFKLRLSRLEEIKEEEAKKGTYVDVGVEEEIVPFTYEKIVFDRAIAMSKDAAYKELQNSKGDIKGLKSCEVAYSMSVWMLESILYKPENVGDADDSYVTLEKEDESIIENYINSIGTRLLVLREKISASMNNRDSKN